MHSDTDIETPTLAVSAGEILAGGVFGAILAALLVILRDGTPSANAEILGGALLFGGLGVIRASRRGESFRMLWNEARMQLRETRRELAIYSEGVEQQRKPDVARRIAPGERTGPHGCSELFNTLLGGRSANSARTRRLGATACPPTGRYEILMRPDDPGDDRIRQGVGS